MIDTGITMNTKERVEFVERFMGHLMQYTSEKVSEEAMSSFAVQVIEMMFLRDVVSGDEDNGEKGVEDSD